jgi:UDP-glucose 4-epimerase
MKVQGNRFLITGGASLIGSHIADRLLSQGAERVVLFDNFSLGSDAAIQPLLADKRVQLVRGDITRAQQVMEALEGVNGVFAVAGFLTLPLSKDPWTGIEVNVKGHQTLLDACRWSGVKKVVFSSSAAVYGTPTGGVIKETDTFNPNGLQPGGVIYGATKIIGEQLCRLYEQRFGLQYVALRYCSVYGERQHYRGVNALYIIEAYDRIRQGQRPVLPGDGSEVHDYVYVGDVARANVMAMESDVSGESFSVVTGVETTLNELVKIIQEIAKSDLKPEYKDDPSRFRFTTTTELKYSREKIEKLLGWKPEVDVREGVRRLMAWHDANLAAAAAG